VDGLAEVWDVESGERLAVLAGPPGGVNDVAFSPDGSRIAIARVDGLVRLFDAEMGEPEPSLPGSGCAVEGVAFSPDGTKLASSSWCDGVRTWASTSTISSGSRGGRPGNRSPTRRARSLHVDPCPSS
jgi:WD40 repeat protein